MLEAVILGLIQGLTEFLPVSSSGHLVLAQSILTDLSNPGMIFEISLHAGTLLAVIIYFRRDLINMILSLKCLSLRSTDSECMLNRRRITGIIVATVPAAVFGLFFKDDITRVFDSPLITSALLIVTGVILIIGETFSSRWVQTKLPDDSWQWVRWAIVGFAQVLALLPGISRSGSTITAGLCVGWDRSSAARFSFLLMIPAVGGAIVLELPEILYGSYPALNWGHLLLGTFIASISGYLSIKFLMGFIAKHRFSSFGIYCICVGVIAVLLQIYFIA